MSQRVVQYVTAIVGAAVALTVAVRLIAGPAGSDDVTAATFFGLLVLLSLMLRYEGSRTGATGSISFLPALASMIVAPSAATPIAIGTAVLVGEIASRRPKIRAVFNTGQYVLAASSAVLSVVFVGGGGSATLGRQVVALAVAALVFNTLNTTLVAGAIALDTNRPVRDVWMSGALKTIPYDVMALPVVYLLIWSYREQGIGTVLLFVLPIFGLRQLYKQNYELENANEELLQLMVSAIEARDPYTSGHSLRVAEYAVRLGKIAKLGHGELEKLRIAALLHDVGKIHEVYAPILRKPSRLTEDERLLMETHPIRSAELVSHVSRLRQLVPAIRAHHERWDGHGYPDRLAGENIPLFARYIALADTVDAMMSSRPYRAALRAEQVRSEIVSGMGKQFDPTICRQLLSPDAWQQFAAAISVHSQADIEPPVETEKTAMHV